MAEINLVKVKALLQIDTPAKFLKDILPAVGTPSDEVSSYSKFYTNLISTFEDDREEEEEKTRNENIKDFAESLNKEIIDKGIIHLRITYPVENPAIFEYQTDKPVSAGFLLYLYTIAYQKMYEMNETSNEFGVWGHCIEDLVYNGGSCIKVYKNYTVVSFECDS
jgi:hypothetical protein